MKKNRTKRLIGILLMACLVAGLMPTAAFAAGKDTGKAIQLLVSGSAANISGGQADYIYYGTYQQSRDGSSGYKVEPIYWRVLSNADGKLFLLSDQNLDVFEYHKEKEGVTWETSTIRSWLNGLADNKGDGDNAIDYTNDNFLDTAFSAKDQTAIADTTDKVFLLSIAEVWNTAYGFTDTDTRKATNTAYVAGGGKIGTSGMGNVGEGGRWWLRSPGDFSDQNAANVANTGGLHSFGHEVNTANIAVRPAFNLDLNSVLFTSAAGGSAQVNFAQVQAYDGKEWKVTLKDSNIFSTNASVSGTTTLTEGYTDTTLTISHAALNTFTDAGYTRVTAMLTDSSNNILYYGSISDDKSATSSTVTIPAGLAEGNYTLSVYGEQWNGKERTDYATGTPFTTTIHIHSWASDWNKNDTHHWHECDISGCPVTDNSGKDGYAEHSFALETVKDEAIKSAANCTTPATYYKSCECGAVSTSDTDTFTSGSAIGHSWAANWNKNETHHWHDCDNSGCPVTDNSGKDGYAEHTPGAEATATTPQTCTVCGYVIKSATGGDTHSHNWTGAWGSNDTHHWRECANSGCGVTDNSRKDSYGTHSYVGGVCVCGKTRPIIPTYYTVTLPTGEGYTASAESGYSTSVISGGTFKFKVNTVNGYKAGTGFSVKANGITLTPDAGGIYTISNIRANQTISVSGIVKLYPITLSATTGGTATSLAEAAAGEVVSLQATANDGYYFVRWETVSSGVSPDHPDNEVTDFVMPGNAVEFRAVFEKNPPTEYTINIAHSGEGHGSAQATPDHAAEGTKITLTATAHEGSVFAGWMVTQGSITLADASSAATTFTMPAGNVTVTARFEVKSAEPTPTPMPTPTPSDDPTPTPTPTPELDDIPDTGDNSQTGLWIALIMIALAGLCACAVLWRRRKTN